MQINLLLILLMDTVIWNRCVCCIHDRSSNLVETTICPRPWNYVIPIQIVDYNSKRPERYCESVKIGEQVRSLDVCSLMCSTNINCVQFIYNPFNGICHTYSFYDLICTERVDTNLDTNCPRQGCVRGIVYCQCPDATNSVPVLEILWLQNNKGMSETDILKEFCTSTPSDNKPYQKTFTYNF